MAPTVDAEGRPGVCLHGPGLCLRVVQTRRPLRRKVATENAVARPSRRARRGAGRPGGAPGSAGPGLSVSLLGSWSWPRRRSSAPPSRTRAHAFPAAPRRSGAGVPPGALPRWPLAPPSARRVSASSGPVGVSTGLLLLRSSISPRPQLLRRCRRPSHGDTSPPAARRAGGFATCGGAGGRQLFTPPPPPRRSGLTAAGAREPGPSGAAIRP